VIASPSSHETGVPAVHVPDAQSRIVQASVGQSAPMWQQPSIGSCVQPLAGSHPSVVHGSSSLHAIGPKEHPPGSVHPPSNVHAFPSLQSGGVPAMQTGGNPIGAKHRSTPLQARPSLGQSGSVTQPTPVAHESSVHGSVVADP
jgi:hypothetical protein